ncbi:hypothetical protein [Pseudoxanthomonas indica]|uniref:Uncharacterized protein n=1 Tax=Pseudoxanthomonas indica TaxID=428993 RepID=A0A1T5KH33_9GAMM|nr:hypothetical protein [Pseudoxanthomonas indica]GGD49382.1 membrane protein [Pseudoxanthomonas indica]SKC63017.1 hypothetical protein SAMN06296058_1709 [Pseudoxanthomonas indica]
MSTPLPPALPSTTMPPPLPRPAAPRKSNFVNILAWLSLAMAALGVVGGLLQMAALAMLDGSSQWQALWEQMHAQGMLPPAIEWAFGHLQLLNALSTLASAVMLVVSWGLLRRLEWARLGFIALLLLGGLLGFGMAWAFAGVADWIVVKLGEAEEVAAFRDMFLSYKLTMYVCSVAIAGLHGWIAWKLHSPAIRGEFRSA